MAFKTDIPPHESARTPERDHAPVDDPHPNAALLKADINSGRSGDKTEVFDPGMAMLGTCEEAAGTPLTQDQLRTARMEETRFRWRFGRRNPSGAHDKDDRGILGGYIGVIALIAVVIGAGVMFLR